MTATKQVEISRPTLRWHGGKYLLAPWICSQFPKHRIYVEPYGGAGSVLLRKPRAYAEVYNDLNTDVVNLFRILRDASQARELERLLRLTPFARDEFALAYKPCDEPVERARRLVVRCYMAFGSAAFNSKHATGFRNCSEGTHVPARHWALYPDALPAIVERLQGVIIENRPALEVIAQHDSAQTLIYCDPPYPHATRKERQIANYGDFEMSDNDHREMARALRSIKGMVVVSGYPCALYDELFGDWQRVERKAYAEGAQRRTEALWLNPRAVERSNQQTLFAEAKT